MNLSPLFRPTSVALIGASTDETSVGHSVAKNLLIGYAGATYFVNPNATTLLGKACFPNIAALPEIPDLALIAVPAKIVPFVLKAAGEHGVKAAVVISSGFKETGVEGKKREDQCVTIAREHGMALLGPNCLGVILPHLSLNASFAPKLPAAGKIALLSQSGALLTAILDRSAGTLGFSACVSTGNKAVLAEKDFLTHFAKDEATQVIGFYSEDLVDAPALIETARAILSRGTPKPIVVLKGGTTPAGSAASSSHTGALAGSDAAYSALFNQAGIIRARDLSDFLSLLEVFSTNPLPNGRRVGIVTNAGGLGVMATDACIHNDLHIAHLPPDRMQTLVEALPKAANVKNPIDVLGDAQADRYELTFRTVLESDDLDMLITIISPQAMTEGTKTAEALISARDRTRKPMIAVLAGGAALEEARGLLRSHALTVTDTPETAARLLAALVHANIAREFNGAERFPIRPANKDTVHSLLRTVRRAGRTQLLEEEAHALLHAYGFRTLKYTRVRSGIEARSALHEMGTPGVLKIVSPEIIHKSDVGGVRLHVTEDTAEQEYAALIDTVQRNVPEAHLEGALVMEMAPAGSTEIILGTKREPGLGTVVLVGLGGIFVEVFQDVALCFAPLTPHDARTMLSSLRSSPLLTGARGKQPLAVGYVEEALGLLSQLVLDFPEIEELDINPLLVFPEAERCVLIDARIRLTDSTA